MKRRVLIALAALVLTSCGQPEQAGAPKQTVPPPVGAPNVLLITVDDMGWDSVGVYGAPLKGITPHIDRLAAQGVRFEEAYVTSPICQPSRSVWMTGLYPPANGAVGFLPTSPGVPTLAEILRGAGFLVGVMGKNNHTPPMEPEAWDVSITPKDLGYGRDPAAFERQSAAFFKQAKDEGRPFFLNLNIMDPHRPLPGGEKPWWWALVNFGVDVGEPPPPPPPFVSEKDAPVPAYLPDLPEVRRELVQYYTAVHRADESVGRVLAALERAGMAQNTLVIFTSDNGQPFPYAKSTSYIAGVRTPMIVRWPAHIPPGVVDAARTPSGVDVAPTILDATDVAAPQPMAGASFLPAPTPGAAPAPVFTYLDRVDLKIPLLPRTEYWLSTRGVRFGDTLYVWNAWSDGKKKFIADSTSGLTFAAMKRAAKTDPDIAKRVAFYLNRTPEELYDVRADPAQKTNLLSDPRHAAYLAEARAALARHLREQNDPLAARYESEIVAR